MKSLNEPLKSLPIFLCRSQQHRTAPLPSLPLSAAHSSNAASPRAKPLCPQHITHLPIYMFHTDPDPVCLCSKVHSDQCPFQSLLLIYKVRKKRQVRRPSCTTWASRSGDTNPLPDPWVFCGSPVGHSAQPTRPPIVSSNRMSTSSTEIAISLSPTILHVLNTIHQCPLMTHAQSDSPDYLFPVWAKRAGPQRLAATRAPLPRISGVFAPPP